MGELCSVVVHLVPYSVEDGGDLLSGVGGGEFLWVGDVLVVGDTSVLTGLEVVGIDEPVGLVAGLDDRAVEVDVEVGGGLVLVISSTVDVVDAEAHAGILVDVDGKLGVEVVLAVVAVATLMVGDVGDGLVGVSEMEGADGGQEEVVGLRKDEVVHLGAQGEDLCLSGRAEVAEVVVEALDAVGEGGVLEGMVEGVGSYRVGEPGVGVNGPGAYAGLSLSLLFLLCLLLLVGIGSCHAAVLSVANMLTHGGECHKDG